MLEYFEFLTRSPAVPSPSVAQHNLETLSFFVDHEDPYMAMAILSEAVEHQRASPESHRSRFPDILRLQRRACLKAGDRDLAAEIASELAELEPHEEDEDV